ncbi:MAG: helix-turn-helix transcriptional regulator [Candidatus Thorarchaeota archaeon]
MNVEDLRANSPAQEPYITTREKIIRYLLKNQPSTIREICDAMSLSINAVRQYLHLLEKESYVIRSELKKKSTGRPAMVYRLTGRALGIFPKIYADFALYLLDELEKRHGKKETMEILDSIGKRVADEIKHAFPPPDEPETVRSKLNQIIAAFTEYGKFPELIEDEISYGIKSYNCLVYDVVIENPMVCQVDQTLINEIAGFKTKKEKCLRDGDNYCLYRIYKDTLPEES